MQTGVPGHDRVLVHPVGDDRHQVRRLLAGLGQDGLDLLGVEQSVQLVPCRPVALAGYAFGRHVAGVDADPHPQSDVARIGVVLGEFLVEAVEEGVDDKSQQCGIEAERDPVAGVDGEPLRGPEVVEAGCGEGGVQDLLKVGTDRCVDGTGQFGEALQVDAEQAGERRQGPTDDAGE